jgi:tetratricopeptide (TPR) repeat protein
MRRIRTLAAALALAALPLRATAVDTPSREQKAQAQRYARQALDCVRRGEDAKTEAAKLSAYREGIDLAKRAVKLDETNVDAQFALFASEGRLALSEGVVPNPMNLYKARNQLDHILELDPDYADALAAKGGLYRQLPWALGGNLDVAEDCLTRAIQLNPEAIGARIELAATYRDKGHPERARPLLAAAADIAKKQGREQRLQQANQLLAEIEQKN